MKNKKGELTRRGFLQGGAGLALAGLAGVPASCKEKPAAQAKAEGEPIPRKTSAGKKARVVLVRDPKVLDEERRVRFEVMARMLDDGVCALLGEPEPAAAWGRLIEPGDTVGIKSNRWQFLPTPKELEQAVRQRVIDAGVAAERVAIDDRGVLSNPVFQRATGLINARPLRTHHWSGVGSCLKNYIMFSPDPSDWHADSCANLAGLWELPAVRGKTRLNLLVMLTPLFHSKGPHGFNPKYTWAYQGLLLGTDPVAVDATGVRILQAKRRAFFGKEEPLAVSPKHIQLAEERFGLGVADAGRIEVVKVGWMGEALI